jgi:hypothetical protein
MAKGNAVEGWAARLFQKIHRTSSWEKLVCDLAQVRCGNLKDRACASQTDVLADASLVNSQMPLARLNRVCLARMAFAAVTSGLNLDMFQYVSCGWHRTQGVRSDALTLFFDRTGRSYSFHIWQPMRAFPICKHLSATSSVVR